MERNNKTRTNIAKIARGAVITALGCALLMISYLFEALDLTVASFAAILVWIMRLEYGGVFALTVYAATSVLCFLITPGNSGVISYIFVFGWFPVFKVFIEKKIGKKWLTTCLKLLAVTAAFAMMIAVFFNIFVGDMSFDDMAKELSSFFSIGNEQAGWFEEKGWLDLNRLQWILISAYLIFAPVITLIYDLLLSKFAIVYFHRIRPVLVKAHIFSDSTRR